MASAAGVPQAREFGPLVESDEEPTPASRRGRGLALLSMPAMIAGALVGVTLLWAGGARPTKFFTRSAASGGDFLDKASTEEVDFETVQVCGIDFKIQNVVSSNLGKQGPDKTADEGIVYNCTETDNGEYVRNVLVVANAEGHYASKSAHLNGINNDFGSIRVDSGKQVKLRFSIFTMDKQPLKVKVFRITFYDLDEGPHHTSKEFIIANDKPDDVDTLKHSEVDEKKAHGKEKFVASEAGSGKDNPHHTHTLTEEQKEKAVVLEYEDIHEFETTVGATDGRSPRNFAFSLHSALACHTEKVAITTSVKKSKAPSSSFPWISMIAAAMAVSSADSWSSSV